MNHFKVWGDYIWCHWVIPGECEDAAQPPTVTGRVKRNTYTLICFLSSAYPHAVQIYEGELPKLDLFIKERILILRCLNFSHLQSPLHLVQSTYWDPFSTAQNSFLTLQFWCLLVLLLLFVSSHPHQQNVAFSKLFLPGKQKKVAWVEIRWIGRVGHRGDAVCGQKLLNTQLGVARCTRKSPFMKWANEVSLQKKIHGSLTQPLTTMPAGTLTQLGSWNTLLAGEACTIKGLPSRR